MMITHIPAATSSSKTAGARAPTIFICISTFPHQPLLGDKGANRISTFHSAATRSYIDWF
jgi:hypothetical protein